LKTLGIVGGDLPEDARDGCVGTPEGANMTYDTIKGKNCA
jgi:hypothetical protein